jgi:tripartite-type tricarboxylate transporter receptor subunit TctC
MVSWRRAALSVWRLFWSPLRPIGRLLCAEWKAAMSLLCACRRGVATKRDLRVPAREVLVLVRPSIAVLGAVLLLAAGSAQAEDWPTRPIRVISPFPAGSASDTVSRVVLDRVSQTLGQPMVIEAKPGAGGIVGFADAAKSDPDGYTIVTSSTSLGTGMVLHRNLPYDPLNDFVSVAMLGVQPNVLVASKESGFKTVADLVAAAKAKPGTLTFASAGIGSSSHMAAERLRLAAHIDVRHVPFRDGGLTEVMAGRIDFYFIPLAAAASALGSGKLNVLAVSSPKRVALLPDVPSIVEAGYPDAVFRFWVGLSAPARTPPAIINKLHDATEKAVTDPGMKEKLANLGIEPEPMSVEAFGRFVKDDIAATLQLAKQAHIEPLD